MNAYVTTIFKPALAGRLCGVLSEDRRVFATFRYPDNPPTGPGEPNIVRSGVVEQLAEAITPHLLSEVGILHIRSNNAKVSVDCEVCPVRLL